MSEPRRYSDADVRDIVERALKTPDASASTITHGDLLALGEQIGVAPEVMARAASEVEEARLTATTTSTIQKRRRRWLAAHAAVFALLNGLFFTVNYLTTPGEWWFLFSVFFWGLALIAHGAYALFAGASPRELERERQKLASAPKLRIAAITASDHEAHDPAHETRELDHETHDPAHETREPEIVPTPPRNVSRS